MAYIPASGSVVAFEGGPWVQSVSGTVGASIMGTAPVTQAGTWIASVFGNVSVIGTVPVTQSGAWTQSVVGTVGATLISSNASVISAVQGSVAVAIISGSVAVATGNSSVQVVNFPTTQNISGSVASFPQGTIVTSLVSTTPSSVIVGASIFGQLPAGTAPIGSVATLQGTNPWNVAGSVAAFVVGNSSIITASQGSVAVAIISGSVAVATGNSSVQLMTGTAYIGSVAGYAQSSGGSVITVPQGSIAVAIISGSVAVATGNSSVMLLNGANAIGSVTTLQGTNPWVVVGSVYQGVGWSGSVAATVTNTNLNVGGSVVAFQGGTQITSLVSTTPSSVQVGASIMGIAPVTLTANTVPASALAFLGATSSVTANIASTITVTGYTTATLQITSSPSMTAMVTFQGSADNSSWRPITGYNQESNALASIATVADSNWAFNVAGLQTFRALIPTWTAGSITGKVYLSPADARPFTHYIVGTPSISGTVNVAGNPSISGTVNIAGNPSISGTVIATQGTTPWLIGSVYGNISGSVASYPLGTIVTSLVSTVPSSVIVGASIFGLPPVNVTNTNLNVGGSVVGFMGGTWKPSVINLVTRNDTISSFLGADLVERPAMGDAIGRMVIKPFASEDSTIISYTGSVVSASVTLIQASAVGKKSYITDFWVVNTGSVAQLITFQDGSTSVVGYTIAPATGGSNAVGIAIPLKTANAQDLAFKTTGTSSVIYMTVKGYQAQ